QVGNPYGVQSTNNENDGSIFNTDPGNLQCARIAGVFKAYAAVPLARKPTDPFNNQFGSWHFQVCQFVFCDGTVHALSVNIDNANLGALASRNGGEPITADY